MEEIPVYEEVDCPSVIEEMKGDQLVRREVMKKIKKPMERQVNVVDENGEPIVEEVLDPNRSTDDRPVYKLVPATRSVPVTETVEVEHEEQRETGEWRYGLRYTECLAMEAAWLRRELMKANSISS